ncbi:ribonuclease T2-like, partial [Tyrophagus putrescentiae]
PNFSGPTCNRLPFPSDGNLLTLQWPISFCYKQGRCSLQRPRHDFVIHGLWPQFNASKSELAREISGTPYPQYCCHPQERDVDLAQLPGRLGEEMSAVWPSLKQPRRSPQAETFSFWRHEWSKHGKCYSVDLPHRERRFFTAEAYFSAVLQLYKQFPIIRWLASAQIVPSNGRPYSREQIHRALSTKESLRGVFRLKCDRPSRQNEAPPQAPALLSEVQ